MDKEKEKLLEINDYYHDELEKVISIMYQLQEAELKYNLKLPKRLENDIYDFLENFRYRYHDRE